jgi:glycosyl hydrolase family 59 (putative galactocerebrosidase)
MLRNLLLAFVFGAMIAMPARAETLTFAGATPGSAPADFEFARTGSGSAGQWAVVRDETAQSGLALEQSNGEATDYRFPLAIYKSVSAKNVEVSTRFKPIKGQVDRAGGIVVRLTDPDNYYVVRANALENNVRFYRVVNGRRIQLKSADAKVAANVWHTLAIKAEGDRFTVSFDDKPLYTVTDKTFAKSGKVGLWTKADSVTRFDRLDIAPHD